MHEATRYTRWEGYVNKSMLCVDWNLDQDPGDSSTLHNLAILLVIIYLYGIARVWDLVGVRQFHIQEVLSPLIAKEKEESPSDQ